MAIYSADEIIGKALYAKVPVQLKRLPEDSAKAVYTVAAGGKVGDVYSWLNFKPGVRKNLYWMFYDENNKPYYVEHAEGRFNTEDLHEQGALTVKEQVEAERVKNLSLTDKIFSTLKVAGLGLAVVMIAKSFIENRKK